MFARNYPDTHLCWADSGDKARNPCNKTGIPPLFLCVRHLAEIAPDKCVAADLSGDAA